jgi:hypothetical protein
MSEIAVEYRGAKIEYWERDNTWEVTIGQSRLTARSSLAHAKKAVDETFKRDADFDRHPALYVDYNGVHECEVLSYCDDDPAKVTYRGEVASRELWVKYNGSRRKIPACELREDTAENRARIIEINQLKEQERRIAVARDAVHKSLTPYRLRQRGEDKCIVITPKKPTPEK